MEGIVARKKNENIIQRTGSLLVLYKHLERISIKEVEAPKRKGKKMRKRRKNMTVKSIKKT